MESSFAARERSHMDTGRPGGKVANPNIAPGARGFHAEVGGPRPFGEDRLATGVFDHGFSEDLPEDDGRAPAVDQASWHLWGMLVGFIAAGAVILAVLSLKGT